MPCLNARRSKTYRMKWAWSCCCRQLGVGEGEIDEVDWNQIGINDSINYSSFVLISFNSILFLGGSQDCFAYEAWKRSGSGYKHTDLFTQSDLLRLGTCLVWSNHEEKYLRNRWIHTLLDVIETKMTANDPWKMGQRRTSFRNQILGKEEFVLVVLWKVYIFNLKMYILEKHKSTQQRFCFNGWM